MIAVLAVETGIAPSALLAEPPELLEAIAGVVIDRAQASSEDGKASVPGLEHLLGEK